MIPLVVVIYRVLMVCHVDFCMRHGEKIIRDKLFRWKNFKPLLTFSVYK